MSHRIHTNAPGLTQIPARTPEKYAKHRTNKPKSSILPAFSSPEATLNTQAHNPLHGITLERLLTELVEQCGWARLGSEINIRCFTHDPSIASSLKFLRRTPWARERVESFYLYIQRQNAREGNKTA